MVASVKDTTIIIENSSANKGLLGKKIILQKIDLTKFKTLDPRSRFLRLSRRPHN